MDGAELLPASSYRQSDRPIYTYFVPRKMLHILHHETKLLCISAFL